MNGTREEITDSGKTDELKESNEEKPNTEVRLFFFSTFTLTHSFTFSLNLKKNLSEITTI